MSRLSDYLYNRLPKIYRTFDTSEQLKRYLETLTEAGLDLVMAETIGLENLIDANKCPSKFLPYLCETFGIEYQPDIPEMFQRRFLKNCVELYKKKGTKTAIKFLARELSGMSADVSIEEGEVKIVLVKLNAFEEDEQELLVAQDVIQRYLKEFVPTNLESLVIVSYGFSDVNELDGEDAEEVFSMVENIIEIWENSIEEEETANIDEGEVKEENYILYSSSGISNVALTNKNFRTNVFGMDKIGDTIKFY